MKYRSLLFSAAALLTVAACDSATAPQSGIGVDAAEIASSVDALSLLALAQAGATAFAPSFTISSLGDLAPAAAVTPVNRAINVTHPCPAGGTITIVGTAVGTSDPVAHNLTLTSSLTRTEAACAMNTQHGVVTLNGNPNVVITHSVNVVAGKPVGPQTSTQKGSFTWTRGTNSGTCNVDVTSTFDATAGTITVSGSMCGRAINISRTAPPLPPLP